MGQVRIKKKLPKTESEIDTIRSSVLNNEKGKPNIPFFFLVFVILILCIIAADFKDIQFSLSSNIDQHFL